MLEALAPGVKASNEAKHIQCGAPDFVVERGHVPLGYVETKDVGADLDKVERGDQLKRYRLSLANLILTDYVEFRWYVNGAHRRTARLATVGKDHKLTVDPQGVALVGQMFDEFYRAEVTTVGTPKELAERMAHLTKFVRDLIIAALQAEAGDGAERGALHKQYDTFRENLLPTLEPEEFADIYAQTMAYGLFAAKLSAPANATFNRAAAYQYLSANRFLRRLFLDVGEELDNEVIAPFLDELAKLLNHADMSAILQDFGRRIKIEDPVVHFYETFLAAYNPKLRASRGVFYTPEPAVQFIVNSVDWLLREHFNRPMGLADPDVHVLDPATGTSTFLYFVVRAIYDTLIAHQQGGTWQQYVREKLLPRLFGFELLMAPYVIAHLKLSLLLQELGYTLGKDDRIQVFLTNALDEGVTHAEQLGTLGWYISQEASEAARVKKQVPIMVVLGNPPYSGHSANASKDASGQLNFIGKLVRDYYFVDGAPLGERNPKWLQDDYVKFIRFAQWRIQQTGHGIVAFVTNHGYLDNPTFRGMRQNLMSTFDEIYVLDLHGNSKKKERAPGGGKDENIFDIQQGVAILLAVKLPPDLTGLRDLSGLCARVHHAHLWGEREGKYKFLAGHDAGSVKWKDLQPTVPSYLFIPQDTELLPEYNKCWLVTQVFPVYASTVTTARNDFSMAYESATLIKRISDLRSTAYDDQTLRDKYGLKDVSYWNLRDARQKLRKIKDAESFIRSYCYRPFDFRFVYYHEAVCERLRPEVMRHMERDNLAFLTHRPQSPGDFTFAYCTSMIGDQCVAANKTEGGGNSFQFPLYLYTTPESTVGTLFAQTETTRTPNLAPAFIEAFSAKLGLTFIPNGAPSGGGDLKKTFGPQDVFHYAYAVFHSPTYRARYAEFLKIDFPRLPLTSDKKLFAKLAAKGAELVSLHLLKSPTVDEFITSYSVAGSNQVDKVSYAKKRAWINATQYFGGVPEAVWEFKVGGYQVCDKWLKDRKGRALSMDDITHYQRVVVALKETIRLMKEIDAAIPAWPID